MLSAIENVQPHDDIRVLVIDDEEAVCRAIARNLKTRGLTPVTVNGGEDAIRQLDRNEFDVAICDLYMPEVDGLDVLRHARSLASPVPVVMITAYGDIAQAVKAMKAGASDFITKPVDNNLIAAAIRVANKNREQSRKIVEQTESRLIGSKRWLGPFSKLLGKVANSSSIVLLAGETGTGKTEVAKEIARLSEREGRFIVVNCAAIPENLLESKLFGTVRGAYTGAEDRAGVLEEAAGGTLFLDEIGELKPDLQAKLLHVLQERTFTRLGSTKEIRSDVRFITATNRDLEAEVAAGNFRKDLYYRLQVTVLEIPPLRSRPEDVPLLLEHFRNTSSDEVPEFGPEALEMLQRYEWPGNIRELKNLVERFGVFFDEPRAVTTQDLEPHVSRSSGDIAPVGAAPLVRTGPPEGSDPSFDFTLDLGGRSLEEGINDYQRWLIISALRRNKGNKSKTARELKMKRTTLIERCHKLDITDDDIEGDDDD
ncbi:MAG: sigma-54 dependent transcriptional regulator [Deltaproteobacteria bacterium]|jgi:DNA-binding NtrC family response regulator